TSLERDLPRSPPAGSPLLSDLPKAARNLAAASGGTDSAEGTPDHPREADVHAGHSPTPMDLAGTAEAVEECRGGWPGVAEDHERTGERSVAEAAAAVQRTGLQPRVLRRIGQALGVARRAHIAVPVSAPERKRHPVGRPFAHVPHHIGCPV